jgi:hypothetical protein
MTLVALAPRIASAQSDADRATARELAIAGQQALEQRDYATAADRFGRADALVHAPTLLLGFARAQVGLGKLLGGHEAYQRILREGVPPGSPPVWSEALADAERELAALAPRLPSVVIVVTGPTDVEITLDGTAVPAASLGIKRFVDPGSHTLSARAPGYADAEATFALAEGEETTVTLALHRLPAVPSPLAPPFAPALPPPALLPPPAPPPDPDRSDQPSLLRALGFGAIGAGASLLLVGVVTGALALDRGSELSDRCGDSGCPPDAEAALDDHDRMRAWSIAGLVTGGVGLGAGTAMVLAAPSDGGGAERALAPALLGFGGAALVSAVVGGAMAANLASELDEACPTGSCGPAEADRVAGYDRLRGLMFAGLIASGAATASGVVLLAAGPRARSRVALVPHLTPASAGLAGTF